MNRELIKLILADCLSAAVKRDDAPCSSGEHLIRAIVRLSSLVPEWNPDDEEMRSYLEWAIDYTLESSVNQGN